MPKLTEKELELVEEKNELHLATYFRQYLKRNPDVDPGEMKRSDSRSKYVHGQCLRETIHLTIESNTRKKYIIPVVVVTLILLLTLILIMKSIICMD